MLGGADQPRSEVMLSMSTPEARAWFLDLVAAKDDVKTALGNPRRILEHADRVKDIAVPELKESVGPPPAAAHPLQSSPPPASASSPEVMDPTFSNVAGAESAAAAPAIAKKPGAS